MINILYCTYIRYCVVKLLIPWFYTYVHQSKFEMNCLIVPGGVLYVVVIGAWMLITIQVKYCTYDRNYCMHTVQVQSVSLMYSIILI